MFNFHTYDSANFKSIGNNTYEKNATRYWRWPCLLQDVLNRRLLFKNKPAAVAPKETITHHFFVSGIGQKKTVDAAKICGGAENVAKTETQQNIRKWIARFYYFRHLYSAGSACVLLTIIAAELPIDKGNVSALLINMFGSFQLFLHRSASL